MTNNSNSTEQKNGTILNFNPRGTYAELADCYCAKLSRNDKSKQEIKNARSAIKSWREALKIKADGRIGTEFNSSFDASVQDYINEQITLRIKKNTYSSRLCHIRASRTFYLKQLKMSSLPGKFGKRLKYLLDANNYSSKSFWEHHLEGIINYQTLLRWISELSLPTKSHLPVVKTIEHHLELPPGTLTSALESYRTPRNPLNSTPFGQKTRKAKKIEYCVWTDSLQIEFQAFINYKTSIRPPHGMARRERDRWTGGTENQSPPTAEIIKSYLKSFFGFCCLPKDGSETMLRGFGFDRNVLSLSLLTNAEIVEDYINIFQFKRAGGKYTGGTLRFIHFVISILRKETGYWYQKPELKYKEITEENKLLWQEECLKTRQRLVALKDSIEAERRSGGEKFGFGRDPQEPIREILESARPIHTTIRMINNMLADVKKLENQLSRQAILYRDTLFIAMLQANPLRVRMFSDMKLGQHLIKKEDGSWWLKFKRQEFKNRHSLKGDYLVRLAPNIWHLINRYLKEFRPRLRGADVSDQVFLSSFNPSMLRKEYGLPTIILSNITANRTRQYIPGNSGFGPHAFRHIVATDIIKSSPEFGFFLAAKVLHDKLETVEANYAHLKTSEFFEPYNKLFSDAWNSFNQSDLNLKDPNLTEDGQGSGFDEEVPDDE